MPDDVLVNAELISMKDIIPTGIPKKHPRRTAWQCFKGIPPLIAILLIIVPISAALLNGTYYVRYSPSDPVEGTKVFYFNNETPQNDPKEFLVKPGDTIYLGGTYDLTLVAGVSKQFAWWKDWKIEGGDCKPDQVNTVSYIQTNGAINPKMVYIDPEKYKAGNWWQWDGCFLDTTYNTNKDGEEVGTQHWLPYANDNNLAFRIIYPPVWPIPTKTDVPTPLPTIKTPTKTPTPLPTINITPIETPARDNGGIPWYFWGIGGAAVLIMIFILVM